MPEWGWHTTLRRRAETPLHGAPAAAALPLLLQAATDQWAHQLHSRSRVRAVLRARCGRDPPLSFNPRCCHALPATAASRASWLLSAPPHACRRSIPERLLWRVLHTVRCLVPPAAFNCLLLQASSCLAPPACCVPFPAASACPARCLHMQCSTQPSSKHPQPGLSLPAALPTLPSRATPACRRPRTGR